jgi:hypothetical protein
MKRFQDLKKNEVLARAILRGRRRADLSKLSPPSADEFPRPANCSTNGGRGTKAQKRLLELYRRKFGDRRPIYAADVRGFLKRQPLCF